MSLTRGRRALEQLQRRFERNLDGTLRLTRFIMPDEQILFHALLSSIDVIYAFSGEELFLDFRRSLVKNKILRSEESNDFEIVSELVVLLAVSAMHNNDIIMDDKSKIRLSASPSHHDGLIQVMASVPAGIEGMPLVFVASPIFGGKVTLADCLSAELLARDGWDTEIELRDDGRLHEFR